ncbi:GDP-L-fucose synthase family protein, partial [Rhodopirellula bahusiensis]
MPQKIFVAGHRGMVGSAILRRFANRDDLQIITRTRTELDLCNQNAVNEFFQSQRPDTVIFAAAKVGGIHANATYPADFAYDNTMMAANAIHAAFRTGVSRFLFLGSTCIYPRMAPQPIQEDALLTSPLEETNEGYALAKIMGLKLCQYYRQQHGALFHSAMPTNLYGPGDNYHPDNSHVIPGLIRRFDAAAKENADSVTVWGSGKPRREFLHVDDLAAAVEHLLQLENPPNWVNAGTGADLTIADLAKKIADATGFEGQIIQDASKPDGTP